MPPVTKNSTFDVGSSTFDVARPAVCGGARLRYEAMPGGAGTRLAEQWVRPPLHLSKVYADKGWAISQLMSPTAGLLAGDLLEVTASVQAGARTALISPAACRVHTMDSGSATIRQNYKVEAGAVLDLWPAPLILQRGSVLKQETRLEADASATVLLCEVVSPGRAAFGESFAFKEWTSRLRIHRAGKLLAYENFSLSPERGDGADWRAHFPSGSYAGLYYLSPRPLCDLVQSIHNMETPDSIVGASPLREGGLGIKILARDGISLRKTIFSVRNLLISHSQLVFPGSLTRAQTFFH